MSTLSLWPCAPGAEDDGGPGGRRPGAAVCTPAEGDIGCSGLSGLPTGPGCSGTWPLPHQGVLQRVRPAAFTTDIRGAIHLRWKLRGLILIPSVMLINCISKLLYAMIVLKFCIYMYIVFPVFLTNRFPLIQISITLHTDEHLHVPLIQHIKNT